MVLPIIIAVLAAIIVGLIAYDRGFGNGLKEARNIFDRVLDHSLLRFNMTDLTDPSNTDDLE